MNEKPSNIYNFKFIFLLAFFKGNPSNTSISLKLIDRCNKKGISLSEIKV